MTRRESFAAWLPFAWKPTNLELFLLIGQSNMAGRGVVEEADKKPDPRILMLTKELEWKPAMDPLHFDRPEIVGVGLGRSFAAALAKLSPAANIGLIPAAMGGSALGEWNPGDKLYTNAVRRAKEAMQAGRLRGILWHQGESDAGEATRAFSYRQRFASMISSLRTELDAPEAPLVLGQLGTYLSAERYPFAATVNEQLALTPLAVARCAFVSSAGLKHKGDVVHFDSPSLREFGRRYAHGFLTLDGTWGR